MTLNPNVIRAVTVVAELTGTELSAVALEVMVTDLCRYPEPVVLQALQRCRVELSGRLTMAAVMERINDSDGRPTSDEAWAMALDARDEEATVVWTDEVKQAFALARPVLDAGDKVGARMAFRDAYDRVVRDARLAYRSPQWSASLGWNKELRAVALTKAAETGLLPPENVALLLPAPDEVGPVVGAVIGLLPDNSEVLPERVKAKCAALRAMLKSNAAAREAARVAALKAEASDLAGRKASAYSSVERYLADHPESFGPVMPSVGGAA